MLHFIVLYNNVLRLHCKFCIGCFHCFALNRVISIIVFERLYSIELHCNVTVLYCIALSCISRCIILYSSELHCIGHCMLLHCFALHCIALHDLYRSCYQTKTQELET